MTALRKQPVLPATVAAASKPWIRQKTLELIDARNCARRWADNSAESFLNKKVKAAAKEDRRSWLDEMLELGLELAKAGTEEALLAKENVQN